MDELSVEQQLYLNVGKCLTRWNQVENEVAILVSYGCSFDSFEPMEISVGYWSIISFEARLKWCDTVVSLRTRGKKYEDLSARWTSLNSRLKHKSQQRAKIAHGSVVARLHVEKKVVTHHFVPYYFINKMKHNTLPHDEWAKGSFMDTAEKISPDGLIEYEQKFLIIRKEISDFNRDWRERDIQLGRNE